MLEHIKGILQVEDYQASVGGNMKYTKMNKQQLLAAETFSYSYANYADHLGINARFDKYMPDDLKIIEQVASRGGSADDLAAKLEVDQDIAKGLISSYLVAKRIVYAENAVESFRLGVRQSIIYALEQGLNSSKDIDDLVGQICYRASDLAYLLDIEQKELSDYSEVLRD
jgi:hypothetical protein